MTLAPGFAVGGSLATTQTRSSSPSPSALRRGCKGLSGAHGCGEDQQRLGVLTALRPGVYQKASRCGPAAAHAVVRHPGQVRTCGVAGRGVGGSPVGLHLDSEGHLGVGLCALLSTKTIVAKGTQGLPGTGLM